MPAAPAHDSPLLVLRTPGELGALRRLRERLLGFGGPAAVIDRSAPGHAERAGAELAHSLKAAGADVAASGGSVDLAGLLARPRALGVLAIAPGVVTRFGLPDFGPPDLFLEDHATWVIATALLMHGARGAAGSDDRPRAGPGPGAHGAAWLAATALGWSSDARVAEVAGEAWRRLVER